MRRSNLYIGIFSLVLFSILFEISGCKKEITSPKKSDGIKNVTATYPAKYFDTVNKLIRQGKNYATFSNLPGWQVLLDQNKPKSSNNSHRTTDLSDAFIEAQVDQSDEYPYFTLSSLQADGATDEWPYYSGLEPAAEQQLYSEPDISTQLVGGDVTIDGFYPAPHNMSINRTLHFTKRNVFMFLNLHLLYVRSFNGQYETYVYSNFVNHQGSYDVSGTKMGDLDESHKWFTFNLTRDGHGEFSGSDLSEKRTIIQSVQGTTKISTDINLAAIQLGVDLGANFTVQSAVNTYTYYAVDGAIELETQNYMGVPNFQMNWIGRSNGIQIE